MPLLAVTAVLPHSLDLDWKCSVTTAGTGLHFTHFLWSLLRIFSNGGRHSEVTQRHELGPAQLKADTTRPHGTESLSYP